MSESTQIEVLKMALEALKSITWVNSFNEGDYLICNFKSVETSITAIKEALSSPNGEAQPQQTTCGACSGSGRMIRDPDIGTDQECFCCDGSGTQSFIVDKHKMEGQEPVAIADGTFNHNCLIGTPLYAEPPQHALMSEHWKALYNILKVKQWVGLTDKDKEEYVAQDFGGNRLDAMDWAEKRLKAKNTNA